MNEPTLKCKHVLDKSLVQTYFGLRWGTILLAAQFPISLALGGYLIFGLGLKDSMSAYYTTGLRDWYVGVLFALATCLFLYKGIRPLEGRLLNLAASFAVGVAIFPVDWIPSWWIFGNGLRPHNLCAYAFFLTVAAACWLCKDDSINLGLIGESQRSNYHKKYTVIAVLLIVLPGAALAITAKMVAKPFGSSVYSAETLGMWVFATYWYVKTGELKAEMGRRRRVARDATRHGDPSVTAQA